MNSDINAPRPCFVHHNFNSFYLNPAVINAQCIRHAIPARLKRGNQVIVIAFPVCGKTKLQGDFNRFIDMVMLQPTQRSKVAIAAIFFSRFGFYPPMHTGIRAKRGRGQGKYDHQSPETINKFPIRFAWCAGGSKLFTAHAQPNSPAFNQFWFHLLSFKKSLKS